MRDSALIWPRSTGTAMNVVGEPITITNAVVGDYFCYSVVYEGDDGVLEGDVCGLDGAGYTLNVNWGDGQGGNSDTQTFYFPKGGAFSVCHYYLLNDAAGAATQTDNVTATVTADDGPGAATARTATTGVTATIVNIVPTVSIVVENPPAGGFGSVPSDQTFTVDAVVSDPGDAPGENEQYSYQWYDRGVAIGTGSSATVTAGDLIAALDSVTVTDGHGGQGSSWGYSPPPPEPVVSISETDPNDTVLGGGNADFDIHIDAGTAGPDANMTFSYSTVDPSGGETAYASTDGPQEVTLCVGDYNESLSGDWFADIPVSVDTTSGIDDGSRPAVTVVLGNCNLCQFASGGSTATATIDEPQLEMWLTDFETGPSQPVQVAGGPSTTVELGEQINLMACVGGVEQYGVAGITWRLPQSNQAIQSYDPTLATNQLTVLGPPGGHLQVVSGASYIQFEFVSAGTYYVSLTLGSATVTASFTVDAPENVSATATPSKTATQKMPNFRHFLTSEGTYLGGLYRRYGYGLVQTVVLNYSGVAPMNLTTNWEYPTGQDGWRYCFFQVMTSAAGFITVPANTTSTDAPGTYDLVQPAAGLDLGFPYPSDGDAPGTRIYMHGGSSQLTETFTTYFACQPIENGVPIGGCVPLLALNWTCSITTSWATGPLPTVNSPVLTVSGTLTQPQNGDAPYYAFQQVTAANQFPTWSKLSTSGFKDPKTGNELYTIIH